MTIYLIHEAAALLGMHRRTLYRHVQAGRVYPGEVRDTHGNVVGYLKDLFDKSLEK